MKHIEWVLMSFRGEKEKTSFTLEEAKKIAQTLNIDFSKEKFTLNDLFQGINVELEHGTKYSECNVTKNDPILTGKIALAHLKEFPDYYTRLKQLEEEAFNYWSKKGLD